MLVWIAAFVLASSLGAFLRFRLDSLLLPGWGVLVANILGSLLIGFLATLLVKYSPAYKTIVLVAFLGSLTTFSSYSLYVIKLFENHEFTKALVYVVGTNSLCLVACYGGWKLALSVSS